MKIAFHITQLSIGGVEVSLYDYAFFNQLLLGNESLIIAKYSPMDDPKVVEKFSKQFKTIRYNDFSEIEKHLDNNKVDIFYAAKYGYNDGCISPGRKTVIHAVFGAFEPHGNVYAYVSEWLSRTVTNNTYPWVQYMINLPKENGDLRSALNIPKKAIVFGRYGGDYGFDIPFVRDVIRRIVDVRKDIYFLFMGNSKFYEHPNIIYLDTIADLREKVKFINTCDALLHARYRGETFGMACAEFSSKNKQIFTYGLSPETCHIEILKDKAIIYNNENELFSKIYNFFPEPEKNWDVYSKIYTPEITMKQFETVFL
jgi:hypothetical protein